MREKEAAEELSRKTQGNSRKRGAPKTKEQMSFKKEKIINNIKCSRPIQVR